MYSLIGERTLLRFDISDRNALPEYLYTRRSALAAVHMLAVDRDGVVRKNSRTAKELSSALLGGYFKVPLPSLNKDTKFVVAAFDFPSHTMTLEKAYLAPSDEPISSQQLKSLLILAALAGLLLMPLVFNAAFYRVLHEQFVLWHSLLTISLLSTIFVSSGLVVVLLDPAAMTLSWMTTVIFGLTVASGAMFTRSFIECEYMHPLLRRALLYCAVWAVLLSTSHAAFPFVGRSFQSTVYTAAFAPIIVVFVLSISYALRRGSRAAKFQLIGYAPMIVVGLVRLLTGVLPWLPSSDAMLLFYAGCVFEVLFTTLGVADRFMAIRRQRDHARFEADMLERLSERDPLTGLLNRRAIERSFKTFRNEGYMALAVLDLDHFKSINDRYGHVVGDAVLKAAAEALHADKNVQAFRIGGEEFVLLAHGKPKDAHSRAERRRQAISAIVANAVPGLDGPVTASMGMVLAPPYSDMSFTELYDEADKLLYAAKQAGRNRVIFATAQRAQNNVCLTDGNPGEHSAANVNHMLPTTMTGRI
ncbi:sensor domain-containing diguanylate cyclase [Shinella zoogloeoides]